MLMRFMNISTPAHEYIDAPLTATRTLWKWILSPSWGASGAFDDAFNDGYVDADACVETHIMVKYYQSEFSER